MSQRLFHKVPFDLDYRRSVELPHAVSAARRPATQARCDVTKGPQRLTWMVDNYTCKADLKNEQMCQ